MFNVKFAAALLVLLPLALVGSLVALGMCAVAYPFARRQSHAFCMWCGTAHDDLGTPCAKLI